VRLLLASDIAGEGANLHFLSHKLIHLDILGSLMSSSSRTAAWTATGRSGGPTSRVLIQSQNTPKSRGDRILELLTEKDKQAANSEVRQDALGGKLHFRNRDGHSERGADSTCLMPIAFACSTNVLLFPEIAIGRQTPRV
jgi:hypothetical protein